MATRIAQDLRKAPPPRPSPEPPSAPFSRVPWDPLPWCSWLPDPAFRQRGTGCHTNLYIAARPPLGGQGKHALKADLEARARPTLAQLAFRQRGAGSERNLRKARRTRPAREQGNKPRKSTHNSSARPAHVAQTRVPPTWRWISPEPPQFRTARRMPERETDQRTRTARRGHGPWNYDRRLGLLPGGPPGSS